jgi:ribosomal protein L11 methyltransferase
VAEEALSISVLKAGAKSWDIQWLLSEKPDQAALKTRILLAAASFGIAADQDLTPEIEAVPEVNWLEESYRGFAPFRVGSFYICGTHTDPAPAPGEMALIIDAATAFGSGEHGTTAGCLTLLQDLKADGYTPGSILDLGCGSGILAIAASKLWNAPVLATDIDEECVRVTLHHMQVNDTGTRMNALAGNGFTVIDRNYDLIIANILAGPLKDMAGEFVSHLNPGGYAIISGLLQEQENDVAGCYRACGLSVKKSRHNGEWSAVLLHKEKI